MVVMHDIYFHFAEEKNMIIIIISIKWYNLESKKKEKRMRSLDSIVISIFAMGTIEKMGRKKSNKIQFRF